MLGTTTATPASVLLAPFLGSPEKPSMFGSDFHLGMDVVSFRYTHTKGVGFIHVGFTFSPCMSCDYTSDVAVENGVGGVIINDVIFV